jgi:hypothetical protein
MYTSELSSKASLAPASGVMSKIIATARRASGDVWDPPANRRRLLGQSPSRSLSPSSCLGLRMRKVDADCENRPTRGGKVVDSAEGLWWKRKGMIVECRDGVLKRAESGGSGEEKERV